MNNLILSGDMGATGEDVYFQDLQDDKKCWENRGRTNRRRAFSLEERKGCTEQTD